MAADHEPAERWTTLATRVLAPNPGPMTLDGTNTFVVRRPDQPRVVIVDPGPAHAAHLGQLTSHGSVDLIVLTHHHQDHSEGAAQLAAMTGAPVRSMEAALCIDGPPLRDGEVIVAGGTRIQVAATPGHTADSCCLFLPDDEDRDNGKFAGSMLTGDTILGRGTTVIAQPDGSLRAYLASLEALTAFGSAIVLPGHGPRLADLALIAQSYMRHRTLRLQEVTSALTRLSSISVDRVTVEAVTDLVYADVAPSVRFAAEASVQAQLEYLAEAEDAPALSSFRR